MARRKRATRKRRAAFFCSSSCPACQPQMNCLVVETRPRAARDGQLPRRDDSRHAEQSAGVAALFDATLVIHLPYLTFLSLSSSLFLAPRARDDAPETSEQGSLASTSPLAPSLHDTSVRLACRAVSVSRSLRWPRASSLVNSASTHSTRDDHLRRLVHLSRQAAQPQPRRAAARAN